MSERVSEWVRERERERERGRRGEREGDRGRAESYRCQRPGPGRPRAGPARRARSDGPLVSRTESTDCRAAGPPPPAEDRCPNPAGRRFRLPAEGWPCLADAHSPQPHQRIAASQSGAASEQADKRWRAVPLGGSAPPGGRPGHRDVCGAARRRAGASGPSESDSASASHVRCHACRGVPDAAGGRRRRGDAAAAGGGRVAAAADGDGDGGGFVSQLVSGEKKPRQPQSFLLPLTAAEFQAFVVAQPAERKLVEEYNNDGPGVH